MSIFGPIGAVLGGLAVLAGAFGAHGLKERVAPHLLETWKTGASYHLVHALLLVLIAVAMPKEPTTAWKVAGWSTTAGIALFSGSLYVLVATGRTWLGAITPIGGVLLVAGWFALAAALVRR